MNQKRHPFRSLRWRLTWSYTAVTVGALSLIVLAAAALLFATIFIPYDQFDPDVWVQAVQTQTIPIARILLSQTPPDMNRIAEFVNYSDSAKLNGIDLLRIGSVTVFVRATSPLDMLILDREGRLLGRTGSPALPEGGAEFDGFTYPHLSQVLEAVYAGETDSEKLVAFEVGGQGVAVAVPVYATKDDSSYLLGVAAYRVESMPTTRVIPSHTLGAVGIGVALFLLAAGLIGGVFGSLTARGMVTRFRSLSAVTDAWSRGELTQTVDDKKGDEISMLGERLNRMAQQLKALLTERQEHAVSEERDRLARELHDSAKQQALAASFQIGTALTLFERDPLAARGHLEQAERLVDSVRTELTDLIHELRPHVWDGRDLAEVLQEAAAGWAHQNGIDVVVDVQEPAGLSLEQKQMMYRIVQEALSNISRHSHASRVAIALDMENGVHLAITDNGCGFDSGREIVGLGLLSMRERAEALGGVFTVHSAPESGTRIEVSFDTPGRQVLL
ncbi:MAG: HAMP domain-containing protein [Anaerolineales bacterium]|nr:HAMP domain-containing protein [Anaerolineales bacterium]